MSQLAGAPGMARFVLRRDRIRIPLWSAAAIAFVLAQALSVWALYRDPQEILSYVRVFQDNPATVAISGPGYGFDDPNTGVVLVSEASLWGAVLFALMSIFLVVRHTRAEEEAERHEVLRAGPVGRHAPITATLAVVGGLNLVLAAACWACIVAIGFPATGAAALSTSFAATGLVFTGVAALAAQVATTARGALGLASAALGAAFALRAVGDIGDGTLSWASPIGWGQAVRPFADERWWPLALSVGSAAVLVVASIALENRRDLGGGLLPQRPGPANASRWLASPLGLAVRLQRGTVIGWSIGLFVLGAMYGSVGEDIEGILEDSPELEDFFAMFEGASVIDAYYATTLLMSALIGSGFAIASALRLRSEETSERVEPVLATPTSRSRWSGTSLAVTILGTVVVLAMGGLGTGVGHALVTGDAGEIPGLVAASVVHAPAVMVLAGAGAALVGWLPRATIAVWGVLAAAVVINLFGDLLRLPELLQRATPFGHTPGVPAESLRSLPLAVLTLIAAGLLVAGVAGLRQRDIPTS